MAKQNSKSRPIKKLNSGFARFNKPSLFIVMAITAVVGTITLGFSKAANGNPYACDEVHTIVKSSKSFNKCAQTVQWYINNVTDGKKYDKLDEDGYFGPKTLAVLKQFQFEHKVGNSDAAGGKCATAAKYCDGIVGEYTWKALNKATIPKYAPDAKCAKSRPNLVKGAQGGCVAYLQQKLTQAGTPPTDKKVNGLFEASTQQGLIAFQKKKCIAADGSVNGTDWAALIDGKTSCKPATKAAPAPTPPKESTAPKQPTYDATKCKTRPKLETSAVGDCVLKVQKVLGDKGFKLPADEVNGRFNNSTASMVRSFQAAKCIGVNSKVDADTWKALLDGYVGKCKDKNTPNPSKPTTPVHTGIDGCVSKTLKTGSTGNCVKVLQEALLAVDIVTTGDKAAEFGASTKQAVIAYQCSRLGAGADGVVAANGPVWKALKANAAGGKTCAPVAAPAPPKVNTKVACIGDGVSGPRVKVVYLYHQGSPNNLEKYRQYLSLRTANMDSIVSKSSKEQGSDRHIRFLTNSSCEAHIEAVEIPKSTYTFSGLMLNDSISKFAEKRQLKLGDLNKYVIFLDASAANGATCGIGGVFAARSVPVADFISPDPVVNGYNNEQKSIGFGVFIREINVNGKAANCWGNIIAPGNKTSTDVVLHEFMHALGAVPKNAPNVSDAGHCTDGKDLMCYKDGPKPLKLTSCPANNRTSYLDCNGDDYFNASVTPKGPITGLWNTANSKWLEK